MESQTNEVNTQEKDVTVTTPDETEGTTQATENDQVAESDSTPHAASNQNGSAPDASDAETIDEGTAAPEATSVEGEIIEGEAIEGEIVEDEEAESEESKRIAELEEKLAAAETRAEEMFERLQRTTAEFQNSQRRREKQMADQMDRSNSRLIERMLPVLDDFDLAFRNMPEEFATEENGWIAGLQQIDKKLQRLLEDEQVTAIDPDGEFDPNRHEAVSSEPNEEVESGHIIETLRTGYEYKGRVLRPALVRVAL